MVKDAGGNDMGNKTELMKRMTAVLLSGAMILGNIGSTGLGSVSSRADTGSGAGTGSTWSVSDIMANSAKTDLYDAVEEYYSTDKAGISAAEQEVWSRGSEGDFSKIDFSFGDPAYTDGNKAANVVINITPADANTKIDKVRLAGCFGTDGLATQSDATLASESDATGSDSGMTTYTFTSTAGWNDPAYIIYYRTAEEDSSGNIVYVDKDAATEWVAEDEDVTDVVSEITEAAVPMEAEIMTPQKLNSSLPEMDYYYLDETGEFASGIVSTPLDITAKIGTYTSEQDLIDKKGILISGLTTSGSDFTAYSIPSPQIETSDVDFSAAGDYTFVYGGEVFSGILFSSEAQTDTGEKAEMTINLHLSTENIYTVESAPEAMVLGSSLSNYSWVFKNNITGKTLTVPGNKITVTDDTPGYHDWSYTLDNEKFSGRVFVCSPHWNGTDPKSLTLAEASGFDPLNAVTCTDALSKTEYTVSLKDAGGFDAAAPAPGQYTITYQAANTDGITVSTLTRTILVTDSTVSGGVFTVSELEDPSVTPIATRSDISPTEQDSIFIITYQPNNDKTGRYFKVILPAAFQVRGDISPSGNLYKVDVLPEGSGTAIIGYFKDGVPWSQASSMLSVSVSYDVNKDPGFADYQSGKTISTVPMTFYASNEEDNIPYNAGSTKGTPVRPISYTVTLKNTTETVNPLTGMKTEEQFGGMYTGDRLTGMDTSYNDSFYYRNAYHDKDAVFLHYFIQSENIPAGEAMTYTLEVGIPDGFELTDDYKDGLISATEFDNGGKNYARLTFTESSCGDGKTGYDRWFRLPLKRKTENNGSLTEGTLFDTTAKLTATTTYYGSAYSSGEQDFTIAVEDNLEEISSLTSTAGGVQDSSTGLGVLPLCKYQAYDNSPNFFALYRGSTFQRSNYEWNYGNMADFLTDATVTVEFPHEIQPTGYFYDNLYGGYDYEENTGTSITITYYSGKTETYDDASLKDKHFMLQHAEGDEDISTIECHYKQLINGPIICGSGIKVAEKWNSGKAFEVGDQIKGTKITYSGNKASDQSKVSGSTNYYYRIGNAVKPEMSTYSWLNGGLPSTIDNLDEVNIRSDTASPTILKNPDFAITFHDASLESGGTKLTDQDIKDYLASGQVKRFWNSGAINEKWHVWAEVDGVDTDITDKTITGKITSTTVHLKYDGILSVTQGYIYSLGFSTPPYLSASEQPTDDNKYLYMKETMSWTDDTYTDAQEGNTTTLKFLRWTTVPLSESAVYSGTNKDNKAYQGSTASAVINITDKTGNYGYYNYAKKGETYYLQFPTTGYYTPVLSSFKFYPQGVDQAADGSSTTEYLGNGVYKITPSDSARLLKSSMGKSQFAITFDYDIRRDIPMGTQSLPDVTLYSYKGDLLDGSVNGSADSLFPGRFITLVNPVKFEKGTENQTDEVYLTSALTGTKVDINMSLDVGASINPGKLVKGTTEYYYDRDHITFKTDERNSLSAKVSMAAAKQDLKNVVLIMNIPDKENGTWYIFSDGKAVTRDQKANDFTMQLKNIVIRLAGETIPYTAEYYSSGTYTRGTSYNNGTWSLDGYLGSSDESDTDKPSTLDISSAKYVKITIPALEAEKILTVTAELSTDAKTTAGSENAYISMDYTADSADTGNALPGGGSNLATYEYQDYVISGSIWKDADEDGMKDTSETGSAGQTVELWRDTDGDGTPDTQIMDSEGKPVTATTAADGTYSVGTPVADNVYLKLVPSTGYVISRDEDLAGKTVDNEFNRTSEFLQVSGDGKEGNKPTLTGDLSSVIGAVAQLPKVTVPDVTVQPGKTAVTDSATVTNGVDEKNLTFTYDTSATDTSVVTGIKDNGGKTRTATVTAADDADGKDTTAKLTVTNSLGDKVTVEYNIHVANKPTVSAPNTKIYAGETPKLDVTSADKEDTVPAVTYSYYKADGTEVTGASDLSGMDTSTPGNYLVKVTATDKDGNTADTYAWVQVYGKTTIDTGDPLTTRKNTTVTEPEAKTGVTASYEKPEDVTTPDASQFTSTGAVNKKTTTVDVTDKVKVTTDLTGLTTQDPEAYKTSIGYTVPGALQTDDTTPDAGSVSGTKDAYVQGNPVIVAENNSLDAQHATNADAVSNVIMTGKGSETRNPASAYVYYVDKNGTLYKVDIDPSEIRYQSVTDSNGNPFTANREGLYTVTLTVDDSSVLDNWMTSVGGYGRGEYGAVVEVTAEPTVNVATKHYTIDQDPPVSKTVSGGADTYNNASVFTFRMKAVTAGAPMPAGSSDGIKTMTRKGAGAVEFGTMTYTEADAGYTYEYALSEVRGTRNYAYDQTVYTMKVEIGYNADKTGLVKTVTYEKADKTAVDTMTFANVYSSGSSGGSSGGSSTTTAITPSVTPTTGISTSTGGGLDIINSDGTPVPGGNVTFLSNGSLPKTGEEWKQTILLMLLLSGCLTALALLLLGRKKNR